MRPGVTTISATSHGRVTKRQEDLAGAVAERRVAAQVRVHALERERRQDHRERDHDPRQRAGAEDRGRAPPVGVAEPEPDRERRDQQAHLLLAQHRQRRADAERDPARLLRRPDAEHQQRRGQRDRVEVEQRRVHQARRHQVGDRAGHGQAVVAQPAPPQPERRQRAQRRRSRPAPPGASRGSTRPSRAARTGPARGRRAAPRRLNWIPETSVVSRKLPLAVLQTAWTMFPRSKRPVEKPR